MRYLQISFLTYLLLLFSFNSVYAELKQASGKLVLLRTHSDLNIKPRRDKVAIAIDSEPNKLFIMTVVYYSDYDQSINDINYHMLIILENAFDKNIPISIEYNYDQKTNEFIINRVIEVQ